MDKRLRSVPFPWPTAWWLEFHRLRARGASNYVARFEIRSANRKARLTPVKGERCGAHAKSTGNPCRAKAMSSGVCRVHGGLSRGPTTEAGKVKALANLKQNRR